MRKILVPTDCSDIAGYALTLAQKFASKTDAVIYALRVIQTPADAVFSRDGELLAGEDFDVEAIKREQQSTQVALTEWINRSGINAVPIVKTGNLADQIMHCIKKESIDLVVMGTHGLSGFKEIIADSVTEQVVRRSSVPVLSLKCDRSEFEIKNIVLASKFENATPRKIPFIRNIQEIFGAKIHLLRINTSADFKPTQYLQKRMGAFVEANGLANVAYHIYCDSDVESGILHFTQDKGMDLIGIGVEKNSVSKIFQKHVSSTLVNHVFHPVLTFEI